MDRFAYTAMSGMRAALAAQDVTAHNIANASTPGFRRDTGISQSRALSGFGDRIMAAEAQLRAQMEPGLVTQTGRSLDVAVQGDAMLAVQTADGQEAYTRRGDLRIGATGVLENGDGLPVVGRGGGPVTIPPAQRVEIGDDGTISIQPPGAAETELVAIDRIKLASPDIEKIRKGPDGLFRLPGGETADADPAARLTPGALEGSNVNAMAEMINLLDQSRSYELQVKMMSAARELDVSSVSLLKLDN
ncbi:MAG TPA: flagellar basal body rod protein FlgF [Acidothermaceae bacterium]|nr:flagellar basal body rod protein FlgF [Acidothermaceae bacterium]